jgi:hypothetical protein
MAQITDIKANTTKHILRDYVTDKIVIEVRSQRLSQGAVLKTLPSGSVVEVLLTDGAYARIRTNDNITGWVQSQFLTTEQPAQIAYLKLLTKTKTLEAKLKTAEANQGGDGIDIAEIEELRKRAADAGWMRVELKKSRDRVNEMQNKMKTSGQTSNSSQKELSVLNNKNKELERRLAAAIEFNEQQQELAIQNGATPSASTNQAGDEQGWAVNLEWFLGSVIVALIIGLIAGVTWLDKRIRQRHGGFRIY